MQKDQPNFQINEAIRKSFINTPITSFKRTKNLRGLPDGKTIVNDKVNEQ